MVGEIECLTMYIVVLIMIEWMSRSYTRLKSADSCCECVIHALHQFLFFDS